METSQSQSQLPYSLTAYHSSSLPIFFFFAALLLYIYYKALPKPLPGIPYNKDSAKSIMGDIPGLVAYKRATNEVAPFFHSQHAKLGSPVVQIFLAAFRSPVVLVDDFRETEDILTHRTKEFDRSPLTSEFFNGVIPQSTIAMMTTERFREQRRLWGGTMSTDFLQSVAAPAIHKSCLSLCKLWKIKAQLAGDAPLQADKDFRRLALDAIWTLTLGTQLGDLEAQIDAAQSAKTGEVLKDQSGVALIPEAETPELVKALLILIHEVAESANTPFPALQHKLSELKPAFRRGMRVKKETMMKLIQESKAKYAEQGISDEKPTSAMEMVLSRGSAAEEKHGTLASEILSDNAMIDELFLFIVAGHETTATTLAWGIKYLSRSPSLTKSLRSALLTAYGTLTPTVDQILTTEVPLLDATTNEMLRLARTTSNIIRIATVDTSILGHHIPKGTNVIFNSSGWGVLDKEGFVVEERVRSPSSQAAPKKAECWDYGDIQEFKPERWLSRGEDGKEMFEPNAGPSLPMSVGPRGCFGKRLAMLELKLTVATLLLNFEILRVPEELDNDRAEELVTRQPEQCFVRLRVLT